MNPEAEAFLSATLPPLNQAETALHNGDSAPRIAMWSHNEPVTLFGAATTVIGWAEVQRIFEGLAASFSNVVSFQNEVIAAGASGDLAYIVALEHTTASIKGAPPQPYVLRVTTVFRCEGGEWKAVHRHADPASENASAAAERLRVELGPTGG